MGHTITLNLPEDAWQGLVRAGRDRSQTPETVATQILSGVVSDPLISLFGCLEFSASGLSERHDDYIGAGIRAESGR